MCLNSVFVKSVKALTLTFSHLGAGTEGTAVLSQAGLKGSTVGWISIGIRKGGGSLPEKSMFE